MSSAHLPPQVMDKSCDTHLMSSRQVLFLAPAGSALRAQVTQALSPPQYVLADATDLDAAIQILGSRKIEVSMSTSPNRFVTAAPIEGSSHSIPNMWAYCHDVAAE